jgi:hypothetical protein
VLRTLSQFPGDAANNVELADWKKMSDFLGSTRTDDQVRTLFYPTAPPLPSSSSSESALINHTTRRRPGFLSAVDDMGYYELYKRIARTRRLRFPDIHRIVGMTKEEGKVLFQVMSHVVAWLNATPTTIFNRRDNKKPPLRADLAATLGHCSDQIVRAAEKRLDAFVWDSDHPLSAPETASILLQQEVLDFVLKHLADFRNPAVKLYLDQAPKEVDCAQYTKRFSHEMWNGVLAIVWRWVGDDFHSEWMQSPRSDTRDSHALAHARDAEFSRSAELSLTESFRNFIKDDPELGADSAFLGKLRTEAFEAALSGWFARQQGHHTKSHHEEGRKSVPATIAAARARYEEQGVGVQEKAISGSKGDNPTVVSDDDDGDPLQSDSRSLVETTQIPAHPTVATKPTTSQGRHDTPQRNTLPEGRQAGKYPRAKEITRKTPRGGASFQAINLGREEMPTRRPSSSVSPRVTGSSRMAQHEPSWTQGIEAA